jgi:DNA-binding NarL/FixJ family response regulator
VLLLAAAAEGDADEVLEVLDADGPVDRCPDDTPMKAVDQMLLLLVDLGEVDRAASVLALPAGHGAAGDDGRRRPGRSLVEACMAATLQDLPAARHLLAEASAALAELSTADPDAGWRHAAGIELAVLTALRAGIAAGELRRLVDAVARTTAERPRTSRLAVLDVAHGLVTEAEGDDAEALAWLESAIGPVTLSCGATVVATAHIAAARCCLRLGRPAEARHHLEEARPLLARWRGVRVQQLVNLRARLERAERHDDVGGLTPRELEVIALVAAGMTNVDIADKLFISRKTAGVHVSNILAKLDLTSRAEAAAWAARHALD